MEHSATILVPDFPGETALWYAKAYLTEAGEECDGNDLGGQTCTSLGYTGGTLSCSDCKLDRSNCTADLDFTLLYLIIIALVVVGVFLFVRGRGSEEFEE